MTTRKTRMVARSQQFLHLNPESARALIICVRLGCRTGEAGAERAGVTGDPRSTLKAK